MARLRACRTKYPKLFGKPARLENDAEVAGLGIIDGKGLEVVITLGTGFGSAIFSDGRMTPHLELGHHPVRRSETYDEYLGDAAFKDVGRKRWNWRVLRIIVILRTLLNYDTLHVGGGNAANITFKLPKNVVLASNDKGITGGIRLWDDAVLASALSCASLRPGAKKIPSSPRFTQGESLCRARRPPTSLKKHERPVTVQAMLRQSLEQGRKRTRLSIARGRPRCSPFGKAACSIRRVRSARRSA